MWTGRIIPEACSWKPTHTRLHHLAPGQRERWQGDRRERVTERKRNIVGEKDKCKGKGEVVQKEEERKRRRERGLGWVAAEDKLKVWSRIWLELLSFFWPCREGWKRRRKRWKHAKLLSTKSSDFGQQCEMLASCFYQHGACAHVNIQYQKLKKTHKDCLRLSEGINQEKMWKVLMKRKNSNKLHF